MKRVSICFVVGFRHASDRLWGGEEATEAPKTDGC